MKFFTSTPASPLASVILKYRNQRLKRWCIRQALTAVVLVLVTRQWPQLSWLYWVWGILAGLSLFLTLFFASKIAKAGEYMNTIIEEAEERQEFYSEELHEHSTATSRSYAGLGNGNVIDVEVEVLDPDKPEK